MLNLKKLKKVLILPTLVLWLCLEMCVHVLWLVLIDNSFETSLKLFWLQYRGHVMLDTFVCIRAGLGHRQFTTRAVGAHLK